ncbi:hypothetical protein HMPREF0058_1576 [Actinomyces urogenitalis DSM 15434]|nr:hypothetical protein HMPREF0058_1576 [Actinomyces urogenitalis DSM 15434]
MLAPLTPAHPRSRGVDRNAGYATTLLPGSSPLTRGRLGGDRQRRAGDRLIPAHAGSTQACGKLASRYAGSSPLTRGRRAVAPVRGPCERLIPAHAGSTPGGPR